MAEMVADKGYHSTTRRAQSWATHAPACGSRYAASLPGPPCGLPCLHFGLQTPPVARSGPPTARMLPVASFRQSMDPAAFSCLKDEWGQHDSEKTAFHHGLRGKPPRAINAARALARRLLAHPFVKQRSSTCNSRQNHSTQRSPES